MIEEKKRDPSYSEAQKRQTGQMLTFFVYKTLNTFKDPKFSKASRCSREESCRKDGAGHAASLEIEREISSFENCQL